MFDPSWLTPSYADIHNACREAADVFSGSMFGVDHIVGVTRGGLFPAMILSHMLKKPMTPISYSAKKGQGEFKQYENTLPKLPEGKRILIVDDICDTGHTLAEIVEHYMIVDNVDVSTYALYTKIRSQQIYYPTLSWRTIPEDAGWIIFPYEVETRTETTKDFALKLLGIEK